MEPGAPLPLSIVEPDGRPTLDRYWQTAKDALLHVVGSALVTTFFLAPLLLPVGVIFFAWRLTRRRASSVEPTP
jgi:hypothetical protein